MSSSLWSTREPPGEDARLCRDLSWPIAVDGDDRTGIAWTVIAVRVILQRPMLHLTEYFSRNGKARQRIPDAGAAQECKFW